MFVSPLGYTRVGGPAPDRHGQIRTLFRDGANIMHDAAQLNLPAYVVYKGKAEKIEPRDRRL
jgi:hypothetical protein